MSEIDEHGRDYYTVYNTQTGKIAHCGFLTGKRPWKELEDGLDITFKKTDITKHQIAVDGIDTDGKRKTIVINKILKLKG
ncbi:MAG: hypothetical protein KAS32_06890 [Candidatus Peribacteraceae bacterium]|nr:hypothetical protein [Candidatus Peribacteraceae bacterium]